MSFSDDQALTYERAQRVLQRQRVAAREQIPSYVARTAKFDVEERVGGDLLMSVTAEVLREHRVSETQNAELDVPASWWQHFKQTFADSWFLRRFVKRYPVAYTTWAVRVTFNRYHDYPDAKITLPENTFGKPVIFETTSFGEWSVK